MCVYIYVRIYAYTDAYLCLSDLNLQEHQNVKTHGSDKEKVNIFDREM